MKHLHTFESFVNEARDYFHITDGNGNFLTRKTTSSDYSFTDNHNLAYTYDNVKDAESVINVIKRYPEYKNLDITVINRKDIE